MRKLFTYLETIHPLSDNLKSFLSENLVSVSFPKRHILLEVPKVASHAYFLNDGFAMSYTFNKEGMITENFWKAGQLIVAFDSFIFQKPSFEVIQLVNPSDLLCLSYERMIEMFGQFPEAHQIYYVLINQQRDNGVAVNLYTPSEGTIATSSGDVKIAQQTKYPWDGKVSLVVKPSQKRQTFPLFIRIPDWATSAMVKVNGQLLDTNTIKNNEYFIINRGWKSDDRVEIEFPFTIRVEQRAEQLDGPQNADNIYYIKWFALTQGPLVYSVNGLIDQHDRERALAVDSQNVLKLLAKTSAPNGLQGNAYVLNVDSVQPLLFVPYLQAGGMKKGGWRLTWMQIRSGNE